MDHDQYPAGDLHDHNMEETKSREATLLVDQTGTSMDPECIDNMLIQKHGLTSLDDLKKEIEDGKVQVKSFKVIMLHTGVKDVANTGYNVFHRKYQALMSAIHLANPSATVCIVSMLPRPGYATATSNKLARVNWQLQLHYESKLWCGYSDMTSLIMDDAGNIHGHLFDDQGMDPTDELIEMLKNHYKADMSRLLEKWQGQSTNPAADLIRAEFSKKCYICAEPVESLPSTYELVTDVLSHRTERELVVFPLRKGHLEVTEVKNVLDKCQNYTVRYLNPPPGSDCEPSLFVEMLLRHVADREKAITVFKNLKVGINHYTTNGRRKGKMMKEWSKHYVREPTAGQEHVLSLVAQFLFVDNLPRSATEHDILPLFPGCADVIMPPYQQGDTRFCYVQCAEMDDIHAIAKQTNGVELFGHALNVRVFGQGGPGKKTQCVEDVPQIPGSSMSTSARTLHETKLIGILSSLTNNRYKTQQEKAKMVSKLVYFLNSLKVDDDNRRQHGQAEWVNTKQATMDMLLQRLKATDDDEILHLLSLENFQFPKQSRGKPSTYRGGNNQHGVTGGNGGSSSYRGRGGQLSSWNNPTSDRSGLKGRGRGQRSYPADDYDNYGVPSDWHGPGGGRGYRGGRASGKGFNTQRGGRGGRAGGWHSDDECGYDARYHEDYNDEGSGYGGVYGMDEDEYRQGAMMAEALPASHIPNQSEDSYHVKRALQGMMGEIGKLMSNLDSGGGGRRRNYDQDVDNSYGWRRGGGRGRGRGHMPGRHGDYVSGGM